MPSAAIDTVIAMLRPCIGAMSDSGVIEKAMPSRMVFSIVAPNRPMRKRGRRYHGRWASRVADTFHRFMPKAMTVMPDSAMSRPM
eukprot:scaffold130930_cov63-Phaeocystis_antarctica.AAC.2